MLKWIIIVWIITADMPLGGPLTYGYWHDSYKDCQEFAVKSRNDVITKLLRHFGPVGFGFRFDDIDCMDTEWFKANIIDSGFTIPEITGIPKRHKMSQ